MHNKPILKTLKKKLKSYKDVLLIYQNMQYNRAHCAEYCIPQCNAWTWPSISFVTNEPKAISARFDSFLD